MRERERHRAQPMEHPQHREARPDRVSRLDADHRGHPALRVDGLQPGAVVDERHVIGVLADEPLDQVDLLKGDLDGVLVLAAAGRVSDPQLELKRNKIMFWEAEIDVLADVL